MRYHLDTIPVWDAYRAQSECPLCALRTNVQDKELDSAMGGAVMESDHRIRSNRQGFCGAHLAAMFQMQGRLGLALMVHTHLKDVAGDLAAGFEDVRAVIEKEREKNAAGRAARRVVGDAPVAKATLALAQRARGRARGCVLCDNIERTMERYLYTVLHLYKSDKDFREAYAASKGLCLPHMGALLAMAAKKLGGGTLDAFLNDTMRIQQESFSRLDGELEWFTLKFDYRNSKKPWNNSRDALARVINKLRSRVLPVEAGDEQDSP